jgi:hypothetical protein
MKRLQLPLWVRNMSVAKRNLVFSLPMAIARQRLEKAFDRTVIKKKGGLLLAGYKYEGRMNNALLDINITIYGQSVLYYKMHGEIMPHPKGMQLSITVSDAYPEMTIFWVLLLPFFLGITKIPPLVAILFIPIYIFLLVITMKWHRNAAADNISSLIWNMVAD